MDVLLLSNQCLLLTDYIEWWKNCLQEILLIINEIIYWTLDWISSYCFSWHFMKIISKNTFTHDKITVTYTWSWFIALFEFATPKKYELVYKEIKYKTISLFYSFYVLWRSFGSMDLLIPQFLPQMKTTLCPWQTPPSLWMTLRVSCSKSRGYEMCWCGESLSWDTCELIFTPFHKQM